MQGLLLGGVLTTDRHHRAVLRALFTVGALSLTALVALVTFSDAWVGPDADGAALFVPLVLAMAAAGASSLGFFGVGLRAIVAVGAR